MNKYEFVEFEIDLVVFVCCCWLRLLASSEVEELKMLQHQRRWFGCKNLCQSLRWRMPTIFHGKWINRLVRGVCLCMLKCVWSGRHLMGDKTEVVILLLCASHFRLICIHMKRKWWNKNCFISFESNSDSKCTQKAVKLCRTRDDSIDEEDEEETLWIECKFVFRHQTEFFLSYTLVRSSHAMDVCSSDAPYNWYNGEHIVEAKRKWWRWQRRHNAKDRTHIKCFVLITNKVKRNCRKTSTERKENETKNRFILACSDCSGMCGWGWVCVTR